MERAEVIPDAVGVVVAWRVWRMLYKDGVTRLHSTVSGHPFWPVREALAAECIPIVGYSERNTCKHRHPSDDDIPHIQHYSEYTNSRAFNCGIWGMKHGNRPPWDVDRYEHAIGRVALWGVIREHARGWRAQYAYPLDIFILRPLDIAHHMRDLKAYGVPVYSYPIHTEEEVWTLVKNFDVL